VFACWICSLYVLCLYICCIMFVYTFVFCFDINKNVCVYYQV
jgi:hypothetical protein